MILNDKVVAAYVEGFSGAYIYCPKEELKDVVNSFIEMFETAWKEAMEAAEKDYDAVCQEKEDEIELPARAEIMDDKIYIDIAPLFLSMNYGARADNNYGPAALENTLKNIKENYPNISYQAYIAYEYSDAHGGDVINYEISSTSDKHTAGYDFVAKKLNEALETLEDEFWENLQYGMEEAENEEFEEVLENFHTYNMSDEVIEQFLDLVDEIDGTLRGKLEKIIDTWNSHDNDADS